KREFILRKFAYYHFQSDVRVEQTYRHFSFFYHFLSGTSNRETLDKIRSPETWQSNQSSFLLQSHGAYHLCRLSEPQKQFHLCPAVVVDRTKVPELCVRFADCLIELFSVLRIRDNMEKNDLIDESLVHEIR